MPTEIEKQSVRELLQPLPHVCVVELGAHCGEEEFDWIRPIKGEHTHYVMVEPDPRNVQKILDRAPTSRTRRVIVGAVSDSSAFVPFHFSFNERDASRASGSLRAPTGHLVHIPEVKFPQTGMVQTYSLDEIFEREYLTEIDLLWVDIQGAENLMIRGGQTALKHSRYLFMEVEKVELYAGEALKDELVQMLPGWKVLREFEFNILMANTEFSERGPR